MRKKSSLRAELIIWHIKSASLYFFMQGEILSLHSLPEMYSYQAVQCKIKLST